MGKDPGQIRQDIEETRGEMGETMDALGYKADVPGRTRDRLGRMKASVTGATPDADQVKGGARQAVGMAQENPIGLAAGAVAVGFVAGMAIPSTKVEDERIGPMADQIKDQARETGQEAVERGRHVAEQAAESARETAREEGGQQAAEMRE
ncbi:MAG: DUF3618 domain-containing protein [Thermoleophilaceae bacterium]